jgi:hypothetical protein
MTSPQTLKSSLLTYKTKQSVEHSSEVESQTQTRPVSPTLVKSYLPLKRLSKKSDKDNAHKPNKLHPEKQLASVERNTSRTRHHVGTNISLGTSLAPSRKAYSRYPSKHKVLDGVPRDKIDETQRQIDSLLSECVKLDPLEVERREFKERIGKQIIDAARDRCREIQLHTNYKKNFLLDRGFTDALNKAAKNSLLNTLNTIPADPDVYAPSRVLLTNPDFKRYFDMDKKMFGALDGNLAETLTNTRMRERNETSSPKNTSLSYHEGLLVLGEDPLAKLSVMRKHQSVVQQQRVRRMQDNQKFFQSFTQETKRAEKIREYREKQRSCSLENRSDKIPAHLTANGVKTDLVEFAKSGGHRKGMSIVERFMRRTIQGTEKLTFHLDEIVRQHEAQKKKDFAEIKKSGILEQGMSNLRSKPMIRIVPVEVSISKSLSRIPGHWRTANSFSIGVRGGTGRKGEGSKTRQTSESFHTKAETPANQTLTDEMSNMSVTVQDKADQLNQELERTCVALSKTALSLLDDGSHFDKKKPSQLNDASLRFNKTFKKGFSVASQKSFCENKLSINDLSVNINPRLVKGASGVSIHSQIHPVNSKNPSQGQSLANLEKHIDEEKFRLLARANKYMLARGSSSSNLKPKESTALEKMDLDQQTKHLIFLQDRGKYIDDHHILDRDELEMLGKLTKHHKRSHRLAAYRNNYATVYINTVA